MHGAHLVNPNSAPCSWPRTRCDAGGTPGPRRALAGPHDRHTIKDAPLAALQRQVSCVDDGLHLLVDALASGPGRGGPVRLRQPSQSRFQK